ncbi:MAG: hypothetical protein HYZ85_02835 [Candidatus Omnitrophica bacterium]|nr:hypothetical protein [Candidatus Omnitrophota bacterium]
MQTKEYQGSLLYTAKDLLKKAGVGRSIGTRTFEYLRDKLQILPKPLKIAQPHGRGTVGFYPAETVKLLQRLEKERQKGKTYPELAIDLRQESEQIRARASELRKQYEGEKKALRRLSHGLISDQHPAEGIKPLTKSKGAIGSDSIQTKEAVALEIRNVTDDLKDEIKRLLSAWDGKDVGKLQGVREKIEELEHLEGVRTEQEVFERVKGALKSKNGKRR